MARHDTTGSPAKQPQVVPRDKAGPPAAGLVSVERIYGLALIVILSCAAGVRLGAAQDEFWLDEIWTLLSFGRNIHSPLDIFTAHHDNNHYLMSLWMYTIAPQRNWFLYRLPSVIAGVATVGLAARMARRWGIVTSLLAAVLTAVSFFLIFYASEARGYALVGCFALGAFLALDRFLATPTWGGAVLFGAATILGTLSHLTFVEFYLGALAWSVLRLWRTTPSPRVAALRLAQLHVVPVCFVLALYLIDIRAMQFGGGDPFDMPHVVREAAALAVGTYERSQPLVIAGIAVGVVATLFGLVQLARERSDLWVFFAVGFLIAPALLLLARRPPVLHERYFYLNILFLLILWSYALGKLASGGRWGQAGAVILTCAFVLLNGWLTRDFLRVGRGHFLDALTYMAENSRGSDVHMSGDAEFSYPLYTEFYAPYVPGEHYYHFHKVVPQMPVEPEWVILNSQERDYHPQGAIFDSQGREAFILEKVFPYAGLSGAHFAVYHRTTMRGARPVQSQ